MFKSHPKGLATLFFTEMWERFSFYGLRGLLLLYLVATVEEGGMGMDTQTSAAIYGLYTALVYLLALPGGWIADRLIGQQQAVFIGGIIIASGHFAMAFPTKATFFAGLVLIIIGTGLLKPNVSAIVGQLYKEKGAQRDAGFSIFYMGINLGAFLGPIVCGFLGENINWHLGFSAAGVGMVAGLIQYKLTQKHLGHAGLKPLQEEHKAKDLKRFYQASASVGLMVVILFILNLSGVWVIGFNGVANAIGGIIVVTAFSYFGYLLLLGGLNAEQKRRVIVIFLLFLGYAIFSSGFEQAGSSMNLFAKNMTDRFVFGWELPASWLQSVNALFIIIMAPIMGSLWVWLQHRNPSTLVKFAFGLLLLGSGFFVLAWGAGYAHEGSMGVSPMWLVVTYYLHTVGELCLSPVGLSSITKLSPKHLVSQMMGIWFMGTSLGNLIAGLAAGQLDTLPVQELFGTVALITAIAGLLYLFLARPVTKWLNKV